MILNMTGGGGAGLNFQVVGGTTQPASPAENTIWVNTDTAITDWVFSSTQPAASDGRVWLSTSTASEVAFNALKKNGLWTYPIGCSQYISGAWVAKTAKTYQGGAWIDWKTYLYAAGQASGFTGVGRGYASGAAPNGSVPTITYGTSFLTVTGGGNYTGSVCQYHSAVDLSAYSALRIDGYTTQLGWSSLYIWSTSTGYISDNVVANVALDTSRSTKTINLSSITGACYIGVALWNKPTEFTSYIYSLVLER